MGFIETSYSNSPNLSQVNIDSNLNLGAFGITTDGELNINDSDLIGVNKFVCKDYLGALRAVASDTLQWTLTLDNVSGVGDSKKIRIPSNFVNNCSVKVSFYATNTMSSASNVYIRKVEGGSYTNVGYVSIPGNTTTPTEVTTTLLSNINAGELYYFHPISNPVAFLGASGVKILCDLTLVSSAYWDISD